MALQPARVFDLEHDMHLIPQMAQVHHDCIVNDFTMVTFLPPLDLSKIIDYWQGWTEEMRAGGRVLFIQCVKHESRPEEVAGVVCLNLPVSGTGPFRSQVNKLLVSPKHRYKGIARSLLAKLEEVAKQKDRWLVMLDTTIGSGAEFVYPKLGYKEVGIIPNYGFSPKDGKLRDEIFFYKDLREPGTITERSIK